LCLRGKGTAALCMRVTKISEIRDVDGRREMGEGNGIAKERDDASSQGTLSYPKRLDSSKRLSPFPTLWQRAIRRHLLKCSKLFTTKTVLEQALARWHSWSACGILTKHPVCRPVRVVLNNSSNPTRRSSRYWLRHPCHISVAWQGRHG